jgi:archaetidylserine synthase
MSSNTSIKNYVSYADLISILNASFGFCSILMTLNGNFALSATFMLIAVIFDSLDGWVARLTKRDDEVGFGKNIDSLSDVISFGVAPGILLYSACLQYDLQYINIVVAFLIVICGILRLARFNVLSYSGNDDEKFVGLPIPSTALFLSSFYLSGMFRMDVALVVMVMISVLMISTVEYPKFRGKELFFGGSLLIILTCLPQNILSAISNLPPKLLFIALLLYVLMVPFRDLYAKVRRSGPKC